MRILAMLLCFLPSVAIAQFSPSLIGGREVAVGEYPEVIRIRSDGSTCSATLIGPRVVLTAAHCTKRNGEIVPVSEQLVYEFEFNQAVYSAICTIAPDYQGESGDQDMALCKTNREVETRYASLSPHGPRIGEEVTLFGYGCIREGGGGGNDGILRVGTAAVTRLATESNFYYYTQGDAAVCFGDSGGPSFKLLRDPKREHHYIYGVNSRGNIRDLSLLTAVYHPNSIKFARDYEREKGVLICGVSRNCNEPQRPEECDSELGKL